jgi:CRP/FNR family transcriptional regulator, cyclic AMP receptor protein
MTVMTKARWTTESACNFLAKGRWFGSLPPAMREKILSRSEIVRAPSGSDLYRIGDPVNGLYATLEGDVRAFTYGDDNDRIFLRALGPGSWFGDVHLLDDFGKRTFEVRAASNATFLFLSSRSYREITADPACYRAFVQLMCIHMRHTVSVLVEARSEAPRRAARALIRLCRAHGVQTTDGIRLVMNLSQADLASLVGVSRQYMNELIARWEEEGLLRWNGKSQPVIRIESLRALLSPLDKWIEDTDDWV